MKVFRDFIVGYTGNLAIVNNRFKVFRGANVDTSLLLFNKTSPTTVELYESSAPGAIVPMDTADPKALLSEPIIRVRKTKSAEVKSVLAKMQQCSKALKEVALVKAGLMAYEVGKGTPVQTVAMKEARIYHSTEPTTDRHRIYLDGRDVGRTS